MAVAAQRQTHALVDDGALLVDAAAHFGLAVGNDPLGHAQQLLGHEPSIEGQLRHTAQHLVFQLLNVGIKKRHEKILLHPLNA